MTDSATAISPPETLTPAQATAALHAALLLPANGITLPDMAEITRLVMSGADINAADADGLPPLLRCLSWGCPASSRGGFPGGAHRVLSLLLQNGADLDATTPEGLSAPDLAVQWKDDQWATKKLGREAYRRTDPKLMAEVSEILTTWPKPGQEITGSLKSSFMVACSGGNMDEVRYMLYHYPDAVHWYDPTWDNNNGSTGLMAAINHGGDKIEVARLLIARGAAVNPQNENGMTAMHFAVSQGKGSEEFIDILVTAGANEHITTTGGFTVTAQAEMQDNPVFAARLKAALAARDDLRQAAADITRHAAATRLDTIRTLHANGAQRFKLQR